MGRTRFENTVDRHGRSRFKGRRVNYFEVFGLDRTLALDAERQRLVARRAAEEERITGELSAAWDAAAAADRAKCLAAFKEALATRAYLRTVIDDLGEALGAGAALGSAGAALGSAGEGHVTHHRH